ncbi:YtpR family tRNA-binding protein [Desertibacillus haloalkaliphilus]|uniref:YtpR family tRNA-binding protein n=1 Tax=Desertibacillus haloalkaliphilus TaxID=1328930 RepID=UPI001C269DB7|nr:DUF4479 family protein [Desertibacillus haloalkaliphilus]MBU8905228.1 DUF4479 domain-containing protein [Desertibacillus haloalkaliphilus]
MNVFYNKTGIGDTLLVSLEEVNKEERRFKRTGDVARLYDKNSGKTVGYNLFNISTYGDVSGHGTIEITNELVEFINDVLAKNDVNETVTYDNSPKFVVGYVKEKEKHPNADKLNICQVNVGEAENLQIVCGAPNVDAGQKVVVALVGAVMPSGMVIKKASLRGVESTGMICSAKELELENAPQEKGILVLDDERQPGEDFFAK